MPDKSEQSAPESLEDLWSEWHELRLELSTWNFYVGPVGVSAQFNSMRFARYFVGFHLLVGIVGTVLILVVDGAFRDLGMALVVGALFGFGAFIAQVWAAQVSREHFLAEDRVRQRVEALNARIDRAVEHERRIVPSRE
jgi:hypothetical protein